MARPVGTYTVLTPSDGNKGKKKIPHMTRSKGKTECPKKATITERIPYPIEKF